MKPILARLVQNQPDDAKRRSVAREYLQSRVLLSLQDAGAFTRWAFLGGTALRFLFDLPRYSEDLDFSLREPGDDDRMATLAERVLSDLRRETYDVTADVRAERAVKSALLRFPGLPHEMGFSGHRDAVLSIKVEIDTNPPTGAVTETRVIRRYSLLNLCHYDRASLLAGKLNAILTRPYTKGRDLYDLVWYLSDPAWPPPNVSFLRSALAQSGWSGPVVDESTWRWVVRSALDTIDWQRAQEDVAPFLERPQERSLIAKETLEQLLA
jgi:predicted nucleotidyltransferase component of viral defense system